MKCVSCNFSSRRMSSDDLAGGNCHGHATSRVLPKLCRSAAVQPMETTDDDVGERLRVS